MYMCTLVLPVSGQTDSQTDRQTETERQTDRQTNRQTDKQIDRQSLRQTDRQTDRQKHTCTLLLPVGKMDLSMSLSSFSCLNSASISTCVLADVMISRTISSV